MSKPLHIEGCGSRRASRPWQSTLATAIVLIVFVLIWQSRQNSPPPPAPVEQPTTVLIPTEPADPVAERPTETSATVTATKPSVRVLVPKQTIRNQDGRVVYRGDVDVGETLQRIEAGQRLEFSHDGSVFENRERRLPRRAAGYYREFVHPTPGVSGPGPQRIVAGDGGEVYYTPDHYRTFQRLNK